MPSWELGGMTVGLDIQLLLTRNALYIYAEIGVELERRSVYMLQWEVAKEILREGFDQTISLTLPVSTHSEE